MDQPGRVRFRAPDGIAPSVGAHRGGAAYVPENTLPAFEHAIRSGVHSVELDVRRAAGGELVVIHDDLLERTTDGHGAVGATELAALRELDAAHWFSPGQATTAPDPAAAHPLRGSGTRIPLVTEVLDLFADAGSEAPLLCLEVKENPVDSAFDLGGRRTVEALLPLVHERGLLDRVTVLSFWPPVIDAAKSLAPTVVTHLLTTSALGATVADNLAFVVEHGHDVVSPDVAAPDLTPESVAAAHAAGKAVVPYTADLHADLDRMLALGVDAVFSDVPQCLAERTGRSPADHTYAPLVERGVAIARCLEHA